MDEIRPGETAIRAAPSLGARLWEQLKDTLAPLAFLLVLCLILWRIQPRFLQPENLRDIARATAVVAILAVGQTIVIISGNIDLSVGFNLTFAGCGAAASSGRLLSRLSANCASAVRIVAR